VPEEHVIEGRLRAEIRLKRARRPFGGQPAGVDDRHQVADPVGFLQVLGGEQDRHPVVAVPPQLCPQRGAGLRVKPGRRLVEEQHPGALHERER